MEQRKESYHDDGVYRETQKETNYCIIYLGCIPVHLLYGGGRTSIKIRNPFLSVAAAAIIIAADDNYTLTLYTWYIRPENGTSTYYEE